MTKKLLILCSLFLMVLASCGAPAGNGDEAAVVGDATVIEVYRSPT